MYENIKCCVKSAVQLSDYIFLTAQVFLQGEVLSSIMFSLYVNYFEMEFLRSRKASIYMQELNLFLLIYADDMVILL